MDLYVIPRTALAFLLTDTTKSFTIVGTSATYQTYRGTSSTTLIEIPNWTNDVTLDFKISDPNGNMLFQKTTLARNQLAPPVILEDHFPVFEGCVVNCTLSGAPGGTGGSVYVTIYYGHT